MFKITKHVKNDKGFTLVELMVTVFLTAIAVISIYRGYTSFSQAADAQQQVIEMQQNLRIGMTRLVTDIRRAGMNEEDLDDAGFMDGRDFLSLIPATIDGNSNVIVFSMDLGSANGPVIFATDTEDNDGDGVADDGSGTDDEGIEEGRVGDGDVTDDGESIIYYLEESTTDPTTSDLKRRVWDSAADKHGAAQTIITNVEALDFVYWDGGDPTTVPPTAPAPIPIDVEDPAGSGIFWIDPDLLPEIDRVEITLVVRTTNEDYRYTDTITYTNLQGATLVSATGDNFRRRAFTMSVQIRNNI